MFNPNPNADASNDHVGIAKRTVANLNGYEAQIRPLKMAVEKAKEAQQGGHFYGGSSAIVPASANVSTARVDERRSTYDASRDPRLRGRG